MENEVKNGRYVDKYGTVCWYKDGQLHREDGPAIEFIDGAKEWWLNGQEHRVEKNNEVKNGRYEDEYGTVRWYKDGQFHREDGPALEWSDGSKSWYLNDKLHRVGGPAVENKDGSKSWHLNGKKHREDGPAIEYEDGSKEWWVNGKYHREGGPAIELANGHREWYLNDKYHREDGPAIEWSDGTKEWWLDGIELTEEEFNHWLSKKQLNERLTEKLEVKPTGKKVKI